MIAVAVIIYVALIEKGRISGRERPSYCQRNAVLLIKDFNVFLALQFC